MKRYLYGIATVLFVILILFLIGFKFTYAPELENSWDAVSAVSGMLGVLISSVLTWIIISQTNKINETTKKQELDLVEKQIAFEGSIANREQELRELELKISLYDKRFAVYECIDKYFERIPAAITLSKNPFPDGSFIPAKDIIIDSLIDSDMRRVGKEKIVKLSNAIDKAGTKEKMEKLTLERDMIMAELKMEEFKFLSQEQSIINLAEFCYPEDIANSITEYFKKIFEWYWPNPAIPITEDEIVAKYSEIERNETVKRMKSLLTLSYDSQIKGDNK